MSVLIKICGLKTPEALDVALEAGADLVGFVFFAPSPRHVGTEAARALGARVRGRAQKVALSVDAGDDELAASIEALAELDATRPGGLGKRFDWRLLENVQTRVPFMLSGGLDALNVVEAVRITAAPAVDVSSGVERAPGEKDPDKIRAFIAAARAGATKVAAPDNAMSST